MLDPRVYRAALLPVLLVLIVVAFSLENRPEPLRSTQTADAFDQARAAQLLARLASAFPEREAGSAGDAALARRVAAELRGALPRRVPVERRVVSARTPDGERDLVSVIARQPGSGPRAQIVVVAARDSAQRGAEAQLSGTAALVELARATAATRPSRSITFASVSGGSGGQGGMRDLIERLDQPVDAVIELGDLAGPLTDGLVVVPWSDSWGMAPMRLQRTVAVALRREGVEAGVPFARAEIARFAWPWSPAAQGVANAAGLPAVRLSAGGESPSAADAPVSAERLGSFGRAALRSLTALQSGPRVEREGARDLSLARKLLPEWALRLLVLALLLPPLVTTVDAVARARRRNEPLARWIARVLVASLPFLLAALFARALGLTGAVPATAPPPLPDAAPPGGSGWAALACVLAAGALAWLLLRPLRAHSQGAGAPGAALAPVVVLLAVALVAWLLNPYAALLLVIPASAWLLVAARDERIRARVLVLVVVLSLVPVALVVASVSSQLGVAAPDVPWLVLLWLAGGQASLLAMAGCALVAGATACIIAAAGRHVPAGAGETPITMRGPVTYAGPGSLGGTDSARGRRGGTDGGGTLFTAVRSDVR